MILFIIGAFAFAKLKGYKISPIFKAYPLVPYAILELIYISIQVCIFMHNYSFVQYASLIKSVYLYSLLIPILYYKLYKPALCGSGLILVGTALNRFVMSQNGGKMPVYASLSKLTGYYNESAISSVDNIHIIGNEATKFKFLTDYIDIGYSILSVGDLFINFFIFIVIFYTIKKLNIIKY